jgi:hypothetical protein
MVEHRPPCLDDEELRQAAPAPLSLENALLSTGLLAAPVAWALHLAVSYGLLYPAERWQSKACLHLTSLLAAVLASFSVGVGWWGLRRSRAGAAMDQARRERTRFMATCACLAGGLFLLGIFAQWLPVFMLALERP